MLYKNIKIYTNGQTDRRGNLLGVPAFVKAFAKAMELHSYLLLSLIIFYHGILGILLLSKNNNIRRDKK